MAANRSDIDASLHVPVTGEQCPPACKCCAALHAARQQALFDPYPEWRSPLTPGVQAVNLRHSRCGRDLRVSLGEDWARMFAQLSAVGPLQVVTFAAGAVFSQRVASTHFCPTSNGLKCVGGQGALRLDFRHFGAARAVHLRRPTGHCFGLEFTDFWGEAAHSLTLTHHSGFDQFFAWVRLHQACTASMAVPQETALGNIPPARRRSGRLDPDGENFLTAWMTRSKRTSSIRVTLCNDAITHQAEFVPGSIERTGEWTTLSNGTESLHFQHDLLASLAPVASPGGGPLEDASAWGIVAENGTLSLLLEVVSSSPVLR